MQSRLALRVTGFAPVFLPFLLLAAGCGGGSRDAMAKRVASLQEEVTRLQNSNDRLAERLQALEIKGIRSSDEKERAITTEDTRVVRPQLKVVKVTPGSSPEASEEPPPAEAEPPAEEDKSPRPVLRDHGAPPPPAWAKPRASAGGMGQNRAGAPLRKNPQGT